MEAQTLQLVHQNLTDISAHQISTVLTLMQDGNTVPFIARYRKEMTGSLDEVQIQAIETAYQQVTALQDRKAAVIKSITEQGQITPALAQKINGATKLQDVEDLYLPYKQKRQTKAAIAKAHGLQPLADWVLQFPHTSITTAAEKYVTAEVPTAAEALAGVHEILAETFSDRADLRSWIRGYTTRTGDITAALKPKAAALDEKGVYQQYYDFSESITKMTATRTLALNRGEKEKILTVKVQVDTEAIMHYLHFKLLGEQPATEATAAIESAYLDAYKRFIGPAIEREARGALTAAAEEQSIKVFGQNLYNLLMQAPIRGKVVLGFDPAYRTGCKLAVVDENGKFLAKAVIYPHKPAPEAKRAAAAGEFVALLEQYHVTMIAIGNGTASRESEAFVAETIKQVAWPIYYVIVNEAGASVYSASQAARDEFPDLHVEQRSAISIARRLQDPLAELVKIDPASVGVGQYQHDLPAKALANEVDAVVERAVNRVGVNLNTASYQLLARISGLSQTIAQNIVAYRDEHGRYESRTELKKVPRLGPKAYEQAVGFLRIIGGKQPLDNTDIHPESYPVAKQLLKAAGLTPKAVGKDEVAQVRQVDRAPFLAAGVGAETIQDIITSLQHPGRDLRDSLAAPLLRQDVLTIEDLKPGMQLQGTVRNVVDFGAFVDIGVKHDGLVHVSKMASHFVRDPKTVVAVGDVVEVWIESVDLQRERIQLSMVAPK
ncbi:MAG: RNA-binding transcriptional accessory protein [Lactobacillus sp.]|uniref:Tex family protein n=1 Tax=Lacticaseibacillus suilingensis TaxID=2799577 RepID=A0ABW4BGF4_9LACO|nr:Tex family protein [Lacticaseibacillus suilingensis]MCI1894569.1 RNA-binding transcriptional accessory protein [Lactobacillus sp.]MCI1917940.1 RNA-binding transcriptional accessory protein [Lactobacillus sp.]MCI1942229.1 RNA-binding transcriptional accessory protein [Lactobacillus sp.]MCI1972729.1 RNA-binding transcriptional accessory protein [Lactobacillus sp.]MCI2016759.1 RNA-binding transcriptional accessory protein [Lactobacillus sp.]